MTYYHKNMMIEEAKIDDHQELTKLVRASKAHWDTVPNKWISGVMN